MATHLDILQKYLEVFSSCHKSSYVIETEQDLHLKERKERGGHVSKESICLQVTECSVKTALQTRVIFLTEREAWQ